MLQTAEYFDQLFTNSRQNGMLIMTGEGIIQQVNNAFTLAYGYDNESLAGKHFRVLYPKRDQVTRHPEIELNITHREGASSDENYLVHKDGSYIWVTGESILIKLPESTVIVKIIHNIHAQKQLERYLLASNELLDTLFDSVKQTGLLLLDAQLRVVKANEAFRKIFSIAEPIADGIRLQDIPHPFWSNEEIKTGVRNALVQVNALDRTFVVNNDFDKRWQFISKLVLNETNDEKRLLLVIKEA